MNHINFRFSARELSFASMMGAIALFMQLFSPGIALYWGGKTELADVPAVIGAFVCGPEGALIIGILYGLGSPSFLGLIPMSIVDFGLIGFLARSKRIGKRYKWMIIPLVHLSIPPIVGGIIYFALFGIPLPVIMPLAFIYNVPGTVITSPICGIISQFRLGERIGLLEQ